MTPVRFEPAAPQSLVKHSTTGLPTNADDSVIAEHQIDQARQVNHRVAPTFILYFEKRVLPLLLD